MKGQGKLAAYLPEVVELINKAGVSEDTFLEYTEKIYENRCYNTTLLRKISFDMKYFTGVFLPFAQQIYPRMCEEVDNVTDDMVGTLLKQALKICFPNVYEYCITHK